MKRDCKRCGATITTRYPRVRFCSPNCWYASQRERPKKEIECPICGKSFHPSWRGTKTCSKDCGAKFNTKRLPITCAFCNKAFLRHRSAISRRFCSFKCSVDYSREQLPVKCPACGKAFTRCRALIKRTKRQFCNPDCFRKFNRGPRNVMFRGGNSHFRGTDWAQQAKRARKRDKNICRVCGKPKQKGEALSVDHIVPYRMFPCNDLRNLLSICRAPCHAVKTSGIEPKILAGDKLGFLQGLRENGWPMDAVDVALALFESNPQLPSIGNAATRRPAAA